MNDLIVRDNSVDLVQINDPFFPSMSRVRIAVPCRTDTTIQELHDAYIPQGARVRAILNGHLVERSDWASTRVVPGDQVVFAPEIHGGEGGKGLFRILLMLVVVAAAWWAAPGILGAMGVAAGNMAFATSVFMAGATMIGGMLVNMLVPPATPKIGSNGAGNSQVYSWSPQNTSQQGIVRPVYYGKCRVYGNVISSYLENDGSDQYINVLVGASLGPVQKISDFRINDQPSGQFKEVLIQTRLGLIDQEAMSNFVSTKVEYPLSTLMDHGPPEEDPIKHPHTCTTGSYDALEIELLFPSGLWKAHETNGLEETSVELRVSVRKLLDAEWTVISTAGDNPTSEWRVFSWTRGKYEQVANATVWMEYEQGSSTPGDHEEGEPGAEGTYWRWIDLAFGEWVYIPETELDYFTLTSKLTQPIRQTFKTSLPSTDPGQYEIQIERITDDHDLYNNPYSYGDAFYLSMVREVEFDSFQYPRQALVSMRAKGTGQLSNSLRFSYLLEGKVVRIWSGSAWSIAWSDNPAWVAYDIATQPVIDGSGTILDPYTVSRYDGWPPADVDHLKFKEWADYCDVSCPDGKGGTEKRFTFNGGFDYDSDMWTTLQHVCMLGRATPYFAGNTLTLAINKPADPVQLFSVGNISDSGFTVNWLPMSERATEIECSFCDADKDYERQPFTVYSSEGSNGFKASAELFGLTKQSEVWRWAKHRLECNRLMKRSCTLPADVDAIACTLGDIVLVQHDVLDWGVGGRILDGGLDWVQLDREVEIEDGKSYGLVLRLYNDTVQTVDVTTTEPGTYSTLDIETLSALPAKFDVYAFGEVEKVTESFWVVDIDISKDQKCKLGLVEYFEELEDYDLETPEICQVDIIAGRSLSVQHLSVVHSDTAGPDGIIKKSLDVSFLAPDPGSGYAHAEIWVRRAAEGKMSLQGIQSRLSDIDTRWTYAGRTTGETYQITEVDANDYYEVAVIAVDDTGAKQSFDFASVKGLMVPGGRIAREVNLSSGTSIEEWSATVENQNTFTTIAVSGQTSVVADTVTDTLTLAAGSNITLTTDANSDTVTIAAAGGSDPLECQVFS